MTEALAQHASLRAKMERVETRLREVRQELADTRQELRESQALARDAIEQNRRLRKALRMVAGSDEA